MHSLVKLHILSTCSISGCKNTSRVQYEDLRNTLWKEPSAFVCSSLFNASTVHKVHRTSEMKFLGFFCHLHYVSYASCFCLWVPPLKRSASLFWTSLPLW